VTDGKLIIDGAGMPSNFEAARSFAEFGLNEQAAGRRESASGVGSKLDAARPCLDLLDQTIRELGITSIVDMGCGDWNWMSHGRWYRESWPIRYAGWEAHDGLVERLNRAFARPGVEFSLTDATQADLEPVNLVICRDILFHMPVKMARRLLKKIRLSARYLLTTTFPAVTENEGPAVYLPIPGWGFYPINADIGPFNLGPFKIADVEEPQCGVSGMARHVALYRLAEAS
jgi:hypothetical protein